MATPSALTLAIATDGRFVGGGPVLATLGYAIVVGAALVRLPDLLKTWKTKKLPPINPLSAEVEMLFYAVQCLNGLRLNLPWYLWADNLFHAIVGGATTVMLYSYAKPGTSQDVTKTRKTITFTVLAAFILSGIPGVPLGGAFGHRLHEVFELVPPLPPVWRLLMKYAM